MDTPIHLSSSTLGQGKSRVATIHYLMYGPPLGYPPQHLLLMPPYQQHLFVPPQGYRNQNQHKNQNLCRRNMTHFDPILMTYNQLYPHLIQNTLVVSRSLPPLTSPFPPWYNPDSQCEYHEGEVEHSLDGCMALKVKVQGLINNNIFKFKEEDPWVNRNPSLL